MTCITYFNIDLHIKQGKGKDFGKKLFQEAVIYDIFECSILGLSVGQRGDYERMESIMKKKIVLLMMATMAAGMLGGCGSKDAAYVSEIDAADYVTLGEYKGVEASVEEVSIDEAYTEAYIQYMLSMSAETTEVTDRAVEEGDIVNIDYAGYQDGVAFDGGTAQGQSLTIGSGQFIDGFEEGLIGANIGDEVTLDLTFPEDYKNNEDLAGAEVTFEVKINGISVAEVPELNDAYVQSLSLENVSNVQEFKDYVYENLYEQAVSEYNSTLQNQILNAVLSDCVFKEIPEKITERYYGIVEESMTSMASYYSMELADLMQNVYGMDEAAYKESFQEQASLMAQRYIMLQAIADAEGLNMSEEEMAQALEEQALSYGYENVEQFKEENDAGTYEEYLMGDKVMEFLIDNAVITNPADTDTAEDAEAAESTDDSAAEDAAAEE